MTMGFKFNTSKVMILGKGGRYRKASRQNAQIKPTAKAREGSLAENLFTPKIFIERKAERLARLWFSEPRKGLIE
jgi:hypothetical protein